MSEKESDALSIKEAFQSLIPDGDGVIQGKVTKASPLQIQAINDEKLVLNEAILIVPFHLRDYKTEMDLTYSGMYGAAAIDSQTYFDGQHAQLGGDGAHVNHLQTFTITGATITVHNALKDGELVHLLSFNKGKKYYVLDRVSAERKV